MSMLSLFSSLNKRNAPTRHTVYKLHVLSWFAMFFLGLLDTLEEKAQRFVISGPYFFDDVTANYSKPKSSTILIISAFFFSNSVRLTASLRTRALYQGCWLK